jgi:hypothetical protein
VQISTSFSSYGVFILGLFGIVLGLLAMRGGARKPAGLPGNGLGKGLGKDPERLLSEIGRGLRMLSTPTRFGGAGLLREKQYEVARQLGELQRCLRHLEDKVRERYEERAQRVLELAARCGITVPPP